ncbi:hypothetical protein DdX_04354 [Ditylenchus destructor]|uniref:Uncharacterized protein n=1 Tax=Ditylenchus destructor TaxID=166010 RepID=A0AAD4NAY9_9BILA|nr:hypothetical protein DdX_04354 [Ditylenchus destructor]
MSDKLPVCNFHCHRERDCTFAILKPQNSALCRRIHSFFGHRQSDPLETLSSRVSDWNDGKLHILIKIPDFDYSEEFVHLLARCRELTLDKDCSLLNIGQQLKACSVGNCSKVTVVDDAYIPSDELPITDVIDFIFHMSRSKYGGKEDVWLVGTEQYSINGRVFTIFTSRAPTPQYINKITEAFRQRFESSTNVPAFLFEWCLKGVPDWRPQAFPLRETPVIARKRMDPDMLDWSETFSSSNLPVHNTHTIDRELRIMTWAYGVQLHSYSVDVKYSV